LIVFTRFFWGRRTLNSHSHNTYKRKAT